MTEKIIISNKRKMSIASILATIILNHAIKREIEMYGESDYWTKDTKKEYKNSLYNECLTWKYDDLCHMLDDLNNYSVNDPNEYEGFLDWAWDCFIGKLRGFIPYDAYIEGTNNIKPERYEW